MHSIPTADSWGRERYLCTPRNAQRHRASALEKLSKRTARTSCALLTATGTAGATGNATRPVRQSRTGEEGARLPWNPGAPAPGCHSAGSRTGAGRSHRTASPRRSAAPAGTSRACLSFSGASEDSHSGTVSSSLRSLRFFPQT